LLVLGLLNLLLIGLVLRSVCLDLGPLGLELLLVSLQLLLVRLQFLLRGGEILTGWRQARLDRVR
jgi:hypothetical protein